MMLMLLMVISGGVDDNDGGDCSNVLLDELEDDSLYSRSVISVTK